MLPKRVADFAKLPLSRKLQFLYFLFFRGFTNLFYRSRLCSCGSNSIVIKPLFWTPECISIGSRVLIWNGCRIEGIDNHQGNKFQPSIEFGDGVSLQERCHIVAAGRLIIDEQTTISYDVMITDVDHDYRKIGVNVMSQELLYLPTYIGKSCFIGAGARILAGTELGDHCVVGANSVVRGKFPAGSVIGGIPARALKMYHPEDSTWKPIEERAGNIRK